MIGNVEALVTLPILAAIALTVALVRERRRHALFLQRLQGEIAASSTSEASISAAAAQLHARLGAAREEIVRLRGALDASPMGIVVVDDEGTEVFSNQAATLYTRGRAGDAVVGIRLRELISDVIATGEAADEQVEIFTPPARKIQLNVSPLLSDGRSAGVLAVAHDVTGKSEVDTIRRDFVANASHELKTPLGALRLLAEAMVATPDRSVQKSLSQRIQAEGARMTKLVEDILDLSLIEEHRSVHGVVELTEIIEDAVSKADLVAEALGVAIRTKCEDARLIGDHRRLTSAVANLLENAITYTAAKGVENPVPVEVRGFQNGDRVVIEVEDQGIGIAERNQRRIFERFYRVDKGRSRASGGTGLGLAIVRHVVQNHWGEVDLESTPGKGSTFRITLPARED